MLIKRNNVSHLRLQAISQSTKGDISLILNGLQSDMAIVPIVYFKSLGYSERDFHIRQKIGLRCSFSWKIYVNIRHKEDVLLNFSVFFILAE